MRPDPQWYADFCGVHEYLCGHLGNVDFCERIVISDVGELVGLSFIEGVLFQVASLEFLSAMTNDITRYLMLGKVSCASGLELDDYATLWQSGLIRLRGGPSSYCWRCDNCQQVIYNPMGNRYVLRSELTSSPIQLTEGGLVVHQEVRDRLVKRKWPRVKITKLPVLDHPRDGFPIRLEQISPGKSRRWK